MPKKITEEVKVQVEFWVNAKGDKIPVTSVKDEEKAVDQFVTEMMQEVIEFQRLEAEYKAEWAARIDAFLNERAPVTRKGKVWQGAATLTDFSGENRIIRKVGKFMVFDHRLQMAKQIIDECLIEWSADSNSNLVAVVSTTFDVSQKGTVNRDAILGLRKLNVSGPTKARWEEAMELITESQQAQATKQYFYFETRDENGEWQGVVLDFSRIGERNMVVVSEEQAEIEVG